MNEKEQPAIARYLPDEACPETLLEGFLGYASDKGLTLYPAQEEALLEIFTGNNVILNTPTGSGKSLVALGAHFNYLALGQRCVYTAPIKALVAEKFFDLCRELGPARVGMMTGDATVNRDAPILCCTAEILANLALREGASAAVSGVVMDEFHFYGDRDRGVSWQIPLLTLPQARFVLMSATLGDMDFFVRTLSDLTDVPTTLVRSEHRPVPLDFEYRQTPLLETVDSLVERGLAPVYLVHFSQRAATERAQDLMSSKFLSKQERHQIDEAFQDFRFDTPFGKDLRRYLRHGIGVHHAGLLPKYRLLVEKLAQQGLLRVICGTDTLGVGINVPLRTVVFTQLCKYDGEATKVLSVRDFRQIAGRAGRKGFDDRGLVVAQAPEHVIANELLRAKAGDDPKKLRKTVFRKPPERGYAHWDRAVFERLVSAEPEALSSSFEVTHAMVLNALSRPEGGTDALKKLVRTCHERPAGRRKHARTAISLVRSLLETGILERGPRGYRVSLELQSDFSLNHALSLYAVEALGELDDTESYALDVLSVVESVLENPTPILLRQRDKLRTEALAEMKAAGVDYEERMEELERIDHPKPLADFVYATFNEFSEHHPWVGARNIRPKGVAREMFEGGLGFVDFVRQYGLARSEGVLLRYLSDAYKALVQTVPRARKNEDVEAMVDWLSAVVRQVDSSLIDEWERLSDPQRAAAPARAAPAARPELVDITADRRRFVALVRNALWRLVCLLARRDYRAASELVTEWGSEEHWDAERIAQSMDAFWAEHGTLRVDPQARGAHYSLVEETPHGLIVRQRLLDPDGHDDWVLEVDVHLDRSRQENRPVLTVRSIRD